MLLACLLPCKREVNEDCRWSRDYYKLGTVLTLKLPNLVSLRLYALCQGVVVVSCPKLAWIRVGSTESLHIKVEDAALQSLCLSGCKKIQLALQDQLRSLEGLYV